MTPINTGFQTRAVHAGEAPDKATAASSPNLVMSSTFLADPEASFSAEGSHGGDSYFYTRWGNPTVAQLEQKLAAIEETEAAMAFASGIAAITGLFFHCLRPGDHLLLGDIVYAAVSEMAGDLLLELGIEVSRVDTSNIDAVRDAVQENTRLIYIETPCNPILRLTDIAAISALAQKSGARCVEQWRANASGIAADFESALASYETRLEHRRHLFGEHPVYADYALPGVLGNAQYGGHYTLDDRFAHLKRWASSMLNFSAR